MLSHSSVDRSVYLAERVAAVRRTTLAMLEGLSAEDCMLQSMPEASPIKWHLGHVSWFFETFVLEPFQVDYRAFHPRFREIFNSYYVGVGSRHPRAERGLLSRPPLSEVMAYQESVSTRLLELLQNGRVDDSCLDLIELGVHHEQQHQELIVTDLKHHFWHNPLLPVWRDCPDEAPTTLAPLKFLFYESGQVELGHAGAAFAFDNERPRHRVWIEPFELACRPVSNGEYLAFIKDAGYERAELWLSDGWDARGREGWQAPLYWWQEEGQWLCFGATGAKPVRLSEPVCHLSYYEADAYARWAGARLPTEQEWELAANRYAQSRDGDNCGQDFAEQNRFHPMAMNAQAGFFLGGVWEWTQSAYLPYPGFRIADGAVGEYNGKFMVNQMVLRGGSCATPQSHIRNSYRNFFGPGSRWQFSGLRLARS